MPKSDEWSFFNMPLYQRLLLALVPSLFWLVLYALPTLYFLIFAYPAAFALCVTVPFVTAQERIVLRSTILMIAATVCAYVFVKALQVGSELFESVYVSFPLGASLSTLLAGGVLVFAAPLKPSWRLGPLLLVSGSTSGICTAYWFEKALCFFNCPTWWDLVFSAVAATWQVTFCLAVYYGRTQSKPAD
jgi:hypothetical protein